MRTMLRIAMMAGLTLSGLAIEGASAQDQPVAIAAPADAGPLSVLTYNVEGLPFPLRRGRSAAAGEIAARLHDMRTAGVQPHIVVLQEAFGKAQRQIGATAGYRYAAFGPDRDLQSDEAMTDADRRYAEGASFFKGERSGKWQASGLAVLSDYPILSVRRAAFPAWACAGFDCLANKGVMLVTVQPPGGAAPIAVIATHLNSKQASGVSPARFAYAFERQVQTIGRFLAANLPADMPYVFAGDTNIGKSTTRRAQFEAMLAGLPRDGVTAPVRTALATCLDAGSGCTVDAPGEARKAFTHGKDWQVYADGRAATIRPLGITTPFGHDAAGRMLSDHIGYTASYSLASATVGAGSPSTSALR